MRTVITGSVLVFLYLSLAPAQVAPVGQAPYKSGWTPPYLGVCSDMQVTQIDAQRIAERLAKELAVSEYCGVTLSSFNLLDREVLKGSVTIASQKGRIADFVILNRGSESRSLAQLGYPYEQVNYWVQLACSVVCPEKPQNMNVDLRVSLDNYTYRSGEAGVLTVEAYSDCYITVFNLWADGRLDILFPNSYMPSVHLEKGDIFRVPDPSDPGLKGLTLRFTTLPGDPRNEEEIWVVATKTNEPFLTGVGSPIWQHHVEKANLLPGVEFNVIKNQKIALELLAAWHAKFAPSDIGVYPCAYEVTAR